MARDHLVLVAEAKTAIASMQLRLEDAIAYANEQTGKLDAALAEVTEMERLVDENIRLLKKNEQLQARLDELVALHAAQCKGLEAEVARLKEDVELRQAIRESQGAMIGNLDAKIKALTAENVHLSKDRSTTITAHSRLSEKCYELEATISRLTAAAEIAVAGLEGAK